MRPYPFRSRLHGGAVSLPRVVFPLRVTLQLVAEEIDLAQIAGGVAARLVIEVRRGGVAALAARRAGAGADAPADFDAGHETAAGRAAARPYARRSGASQNGTRSPPGRVK